MGNFLTQIKDIVSKYQTNKIVILGKGASIDEIELNNLSNTIKIGINDVEQIIPCDFSIFHDEWVINSLKQNKFNSRCYISPFTLEKNSIASRFLPLTQDNIDLMFSRLSNVFENEFIVEEVLFITALKLSRYISKIKGEKLDIFFIGFDFDPSKGYSKKLNLEFSKSQYKLINARILPQEQYFLNALYLLQNSELNIIHVGDKSYSKISSKAFNIMFTSKTRDEIKPNNVLVVAEFTSNHFGDRDRLEKMVRLSVDAGADLIKVQKRDVLTFYSTEQLKSPYKSPFGNTFLDYRMQIELKKDDFYFLDKLCKEFGIGWFSSILDKPSYLFMKEFNPTLIKLPSTISEHKKFLEFVANDYSHDLVISTGMTNADFLDELIKRFAHLPKFYLMHTNSAYPTPIEDANISVLKHYSELSKTFSNIIPAYSSHDDGSFGSVIAIGAGALMVEKHVKLGSSDWAHFDSVALDLQNGDFKRYVKDIRKATLCLGDGIKKINISEHHKY